MKVDTIWRVRTNPASSAHGRLYSENLRVGYFRRLESAKTFSRLRRLSLPLRKLLAQLSSNAFSRIYIARSFDNRPFVPPSDVLSPSTSLVTGGSGVSLGARLLRRARRDNALKHWCSQHYTNWDRIQPSQRLPMADTDAGETGSMPAPEEVVSGEGDTALDSMPEASEVEGAAGKTILNLSTVAVLIRILRCPEGRFLSAITERNYQGCYGPLTLGLNRRRCYNGIGRQRCSS